MDGRGESVLGGQFKGGKMGRPTIVCLCGSTRFKDEFVKANLKETLAGNIVLSIGCDMRTDKEIFGELSDDQETWSEEVKKTKEKLDELHIEKIKLADEILVLNPGGYVGKSTSKEIYHALIWHKRIRALNPFICPICGEMVDTTDGLVHYCK